MRHWAAVKVPFTKARKFIASDGGLFPPPVGGWDAISSLANMKSDRAVQLTNFIPRPGWAEPRKGFTIQAGNMASGAPVETIMAYNSFTSSNALFAAAGTVIYDITAGGAGVSVVTGLSNARWQHKIFSNSSGAQYLVLVNGADAPHLFDGTTWTTPGYSGTGVTASTFIHVNAHKGRLWFVQKNSTAPVYLNTVGAVSGAGTTFELGSFMTRGGFVMAIGTWTIDTKQTVDEYIAFITSRGQVIVYEGTDPTSASTWTLVGVYDVGPPIGRRCFCRIAGNLFLITLDGIQGMSEMLSTDRAAANRVSITSNILTAMNDAAAAFKDHFGWQFIEFAKGTLAILNIPTAENDTQIQYCMNTITGAWCDFSGINANCWEVDVNDNIYFGGNNGTAYKWNTGSLDYIAPIVCTYRGAFNKFGEAAQLKRWHSLQPQIIADTTALPALGLNVDFRDDAALSTAQVAAPQGTLWDEFNWDQANWSLSGTVSPSWTAVTGLGHYSSVKMVLTTGATNGGALWGSAEWGVDVWTSLSSGAIQFEYNGSNVAFERGAFV